MSKKSVFMFNVNVANEKLNDEIKLIIDSYLKEENFLYNNAEKCFVTGDLSKEETKDANINMVTNIVFGIQPYYKIRYANLHRCFEYEISGNQLIIKAFILNAFSNIKQYIHSSINSSIAGKEYYKDLQTRLFKVLSTHDITLQSIKTEKVKDKGSLNLLKKTLLLIIPIIVLFTIIVIISYYSNN